ncbi:protein ABHD14B-like [Asterias rubens]|uniref:protein ABHD14B-like n=1 Tax=Asterias rubens TaxID=7604 RepID=UPI0014556D7A|nr:protein ABHD14B-like [Asterias rubens]XP_033645159.1 protein ABHD14B-like [Asterias rubens]XP_033645169.1 protein ABHD14B-like [Asterias rubens]XP_033645178.1 protein ABHD14B-like [Asterias rubens]
MANSAGMSFNSKVVLFVVILGAVVLFYKYNSSKVNTEELDEELLIKDLQKASLGVLGMSNWDEIKKVAVANLALRVTDGKVDLGGKGLVFRREVVDSTQKKTKGSIVFLHGMKFKSQTWLDLGTLHVIASYGYRTIAVDLPGFGETAAISGLNPVDFLTEFLKSMKIEDPGNVLIVSPSMSGSFSLPFLMAHPDRFKGFVPVAPVDTQKYNAAAYQQLKVPTMIVYGSKDTTLGVQSLGNLRNIPGSGIVKIEEAGHACYLDQPLVFHKHLKDFADKVYSQ